MVWTRAQRSMKLEMNWWSWEFLNEEEWRKRGMRRFVFYQWCCFSYISRCSLQLFLVSLLAQSTSELMIPARLALKTGIYPYTVQHFQFLHLIIDFPLLILLSFTISGHFSQPELLGNAPSAKGHDLMWMTDRERLPEKMVEQTKRRTNAMISGRSRHSAGGILYVSQSLTLISSLEGA